MSDVRRVFADICRGYSTLRYRDNLFYIKHLSHLDQVELDDFGETMKLEAVKKGMPAVAEQLVWLGKNGLWTDKDEKSFESLKKQIANLNQTKTKLFLPSDKERMDLLVADARKKLYLAAHKRVSLLGTTQERYVEDKNLLYYLHLSLFKDSRLTQPVYVSKELNDVNDEELNDVLGEYNKIVGLSDEKGIRKVAVSDIFMAYFSNCGEDTGRFFARPTSELSFYQLNLLHWGRHFRDIFKHAHNLPPEALGDPDKVEEYVTGAAKAKEIVNQGPKRGHSDGTETQFVGIVGSSEDMKKLGIKTSNNGPIKLANGNVV